MGGRHPQPKQRTVVFTTFHLPLSSSLCHRVIPLFVVSQTYCQLCYGSLMSGVSESSPLESLHWGGIKVSGQCTECLLLRKSANLILQLVVACSAALSIFTKISSRLICACLVQLCPDTCTTCSCKSILQCFACNIYLVSLDCYITCYQSLA